MEIVDAHMHFWTPATHPWLEDIKDGSHPAGKFGKKCTGTKISTQIHFFRTSGHIHASAVQAGHRGL